jgi:hypothetical protein
MIFDEKIGSRTQINFKKVYDLHFFLTIQVTLFKNLYDCYYLNSKVY